jgi:hypothetical protein
MWALCSNCTCAYVLYGFWLIPHPVVIWLTWGSMECMYVCVYTEFYNPFTPASILSSVIQFEFPLRVLKIESNNFLLMMCQIVLLTDMTLLYLDFRHKIINLYVIQFLKPLVGKHLWFYEMLVSWVSSQRRDQTGCFSSNTLDSYVGGAQFESWLGSHVSRLWFFIIFLSPFRQMLGVPWLRHDHFPPNVIHLPSIDAV